MVCRPLPNELCIRPRISNLVDRRPRKLICRDVANCISAGLNRMHVDVRERVENVGCIDQTRPIELDILTGRKVAVTFVPFIRDVGQLAHLLTRERPIRDGNSQHIGMKLQINTVHEP